MPLFKGKMAFLLALLLSSNAFAGDGYIIGLGAEGDTSDSLAFSTFGDFGLSEKTWISVTAAKAQAEGVFSQLNTLYGDIGLDHFFDPIGIRIGAAYWGDEDRMRHDFHSCYLRRSYCLLPDMRRRCYLSREHRLPGPNWRSAPRFRRWWPI